MIAAGGGRRLLGHFLKARGEQRRAIARDAFFRAAGGLTPSLAVESDGIRFHLNTADKEISRIVFIFGLYDRPLMHAAFEGLRRLGGPADFAGKLLLDVGANIGTTTLTACGHFGAGGAIAFEPDPVNLRFLDMNVRDNGLADTVDIHRAAVSDATGPLWLERSDYNAGDHRVSGEAPDASAADSIRIEAVALDDLVADSRIDPERVGAMWLDVQGHEGQALAGATSILRAGVPVVVEYWPHGLREAGGLDTVNGLIGEHYGRFIDLGRPAEVGETRFDVMGANELSVIAERYGDEDDHTDLLLVPPGLDG